MIKIEHVTTSGWQASLRGMRNPLNSWDKSDSEFFGDSNFKIGPNDLDLMKRLTKAGSDHRKFLRMIIIYMDITAPLYWWKEYDTYKVGTVANSCSTMHKISDKEFTLDDFSHDHLAESNIKTLKEIIEKLNIAREDYIWSKKKNKEYWWQMIQLLPSSYNQKRTVMMSYEVALHEYFARRNHKLDEWHRYCDELLKLPYFEILAKEVE